VAEIAKRGTEIVEFGPMQVKKSVCGNGHAPKTQVQNALKMIFKLDEIPKPDDAADAIAIAYTASLVKLPSMK
jgi:crossover junction endodeoxyribonuclease RuvC